LFSLEFQITRSDHLVWTDMEEERRASEDPGLPKGEECSKEKRVSGEGNQYDALRLANISRPLLGK